MNRPWTIIAVIVVVVLIFVGWEWRHSPLFSQFFGATSQGQLVAQVHYQCNAEKSMDASFYAGGQAPAPAPGEPPQPQGSVDLTLSDGRTATLAQTISADGARYANKDESFVFWSKGNGALVLENNKEQSYTGCIKVAADPGGLPQVYESGPNGFSVRYPSGYRADDGYSYQEGTGKAIAGVAFTIDPAMATGTNLASDSYISVEEIPNTAQCTADKFLSVAKASTLSEGDMTYSYASSTGAGAGNRYEEQVFALPGTNPCIAVRYFIHYAVLENYPPGAVQAFDEGALIDQFDAIRQTLVVNQ